MKWLLAVMLLFLFPRDPAAQATNEGVLARAGVQQSTIEIGGQTYLEIDISAPPGTEVRGLDPARLDGMNGFELLNGNRLSTVAERPELLLQQRFLITSFDTGYALIPPLPYVFQRPDGSVDTAFTNDVRLRILGIPVDEDSELMPIKPIIDEPLTWEDFWWLYLAGAAGAGGYAFLLWRRRQNAAPPPPPPPLPADAVAIRALDELEQRRLWQQGQTKPYYTRLTAILRDYLRGRFDIPAPEMTSYQIVNALAQLDELSYEQREELGELLQLSDLVKFAKATPAEDLHPRSLQRVRAFVLTTAAVPPPVSEDDPEHVPTV